MIEFYNEDIQYPDINNDRLVDWLTDVIHVNNFEVGELTYIFCSDEYLIEINKKYLNHDYNTDIITFNYNQGKVVSGDIFISIDTVNKNAQFYQVTYENELARVIVHGVLHLVGFDDKTDEEQEIMTKEEDKALALFYA